MSISGLIVSLCTTVITGFLIPTIRSYLRNTKYAYVLKVVDVLVKSAEQQITATGSGKDKYALVAEALSKLKGIKLSEEEIKTLIESSVYSLDDSE